ncbi:MAG: NAD(P)/FAD-dependent oxidoreductase [Deltaproteobacteria bacterium]|nr:NAD(P)/FAD-dependent oxidoreductase [Deltaproteobacteria bacterium]
MVTGSKAAVGSAGRYFEPSYDVIVIGAGNGGLCAALKLVLEGARVLLLEQHNLPGGFATSFVRGRFEFETSLHELSNVGSLENKGFVRKFLQDEAGVAVDFAAVPEAYHLILTDRKVNVKVPFGIDRFINTIADAVPGSREPLTRYMEVCREVFQAIGYVSRAQGKPDPSVLMEQYRSFMTTAGYSVDEVTRQFGFSDEALDLIYPYWCYLGIPVDRLSFTIWALVLYDYLERGAYIPMMTSHGMSAAIDARIRELGGRTEYNTRVTAILVEDGRVVGVETERGERIGTSWVIAGLSPHLVYNSLVTPRASLPADAFKLTNARKIGASAFVVYLGLDASPDDLNIESYGYFIGASMDTNKAYENFFTFEPPRMQASICLNRANPDCSPPGTTILSMTALAGPDTWKDVKPAEYYRVKSEFARDIIDQFSEVVGSPLREHIEEIEIATPQTFARYTGSYKGSIYAYEQEPWDSVVARAMTLPQEQYVTGLEFAGGYAAMGNGYEATMLSGRTTAQMVMAKMRRS